MVARIASITDIIIFWPNGTNNITVRWIDTNEQPGTTVGPAKSEHIKAFMARFARENPGHPAFPS